MHRFTAEMDYWLAKPFWGRGIATAAVMTFTEWAFNSFKLYRIFAESYTTNPAFARVLEKSGFIKEGVLRSSVFKNATVVDQVLYTKVRDCE